MNLFDLVSTIIELVLVLIKCLCRLFCARAYEDIEAAIGAIRNPQLFYDDARKLQDLLNEIRPMRPSEERNKWIEEAEETINKVNQLGPLEGGSSSNHNDDRQSNCLCLPCDGNACSQCKLHRKIRKLTARGDIIIKRSTLGRETVERFDDVPIIGDGTSTADRNLARVIDMINDENLWCIGVYGPGGVGKTTLAKALNNKLAETRSPFSLVKFIELKANDGHSEVQKAIASSLELNMGDGTEGEEAIPKRLKGQIRNTLQMKKFLLILDNVWSESIQLSSIGIPKGQKGSKIILTTRSKRVCTKMDAIEIKMEYLTEEEAWKLFAEKVGKEVVNDKAIKPLAEEVCKECGYLPLALVVVGSAMKGETNTAVWQTAITSLRSSVPMDVEIESKVYNPLKLSYDALDDTLKDCFLYCSLYPEGYPIEIDELEPCWVAENLIDEGLYYTEAYNKGLGLINRLKESCLVEDAWTSSGQHVKLHDVVRDVARWIGKSGERSKSNVFSGHGVSLSPIVTLPEEVKNFKWISFVDNSKIELPNYEKDYFSATTLLVRWTRGKDFDNSKIELPNYEKDYFSATTRAEDFDKLPLRLERKERKKHLMISTEFLKGFPAVKVLNLEGVESFDASLLELEELHALVLRDCSDIKELPTANNIKILDLSTSCLSNIPKGMKAFSRLKVLNLYKTNDLKGINGETIQSLNLLEVLDMDHSGYRWPVRKRSESEEATLEDLSRLQWLREAYLELAETDGTYEECSWMARLECFYFSNHCVIQSWDCRSNFIRQSKGKIFDIHMGSGDTRVGSFVLHAEEVRSLSRKIIVKETFANFSSTDQFNSKLKKLRIHVLFPLEGLITISSESAIAEDNVRKHVTEVCVNGTGLFGRFSNSVFFNVDELYMKKWYGGFSNLASALGADFSKLKSLELVDGHSVFSSDDLHIVLPELERISLIRSSSVVIFNCGPTQLQAIAPNLKILEIDSLRQSEILCNCEPNEQWPSLEILQVKRCPMLKELPFMPSVKQIRGEQWWWNQVEWDSEKVKSHMNQRFKPL